MTAVDLAGVPLDRSALIVMHYQADVFALLFGSERSPLVERCNSLIGQWRATGRPLIFANFALGPDYEMASKNNRLATALTQTGLFRVPTAVGGLAIEPGDTIVTCPRVSIFERTSIDADLRGRGIDVLVMAGVTTTGVVLSSVSWASDADYDIRLVRGCCYDPDEVAHDALFRTGLQTRAIVL